MNLQKYRTWLKNKQLAHSTINLYSTIAKKYQDQVLNTPNLQQIISQGLTKYEPSYLILTREILKSYSQFKKIGKINWEKITKLIPLVQKKFFCYSFGRRVRTVKESEIWEKGRNLNQK